MPSGPDVRRARLVAPLVALALGACSTTPSPPASGTPAPPAAAGRPYDADALLAAMRDSRRPGGVPDDLETPAIASALAEAIWTVDGRPWSTMSAGGSCGPSQCTLEIGGAHAGAAGEDLWVFTVTPTTAAVSVLSAELRSLPPALVAALDELARGLYPDASLLLLTTTAWVPPPAIGRFELSYRRGTEDGCGVDLTLDAGASAIVADRVTGC